MTAGERAVVWLPLAGGRRRAVEVAIDPTHLGQALAKWGQLLGPNPGLQVSVYPARPDAGPPNPVLGLPDLDRGEDPARAVAAHLVGPHGLSGETTAWLGEYEGLVGLVGEHDLDHAEHPGGQLGHTHPSPWRPTPPAPSGSQFPMVS
jgi:hypothetical protein